MFQFENFRVRKLTVINALNYYITLCMVFLCMISIESETNAFKVSIIKTADPVKKKVFFCYYRLAKGICGILCLYFHNCSPYYSKKIADWCFVLIYSFFFLQFAKGKQEKLLRYPHELE